MGKESISSKLYLLQTKVLNKSREVGKKIYDVKEMLATEFEEFVSNITKKFEGAVTHLLFNKYVRN